jgi:hypothetical protein
VGGTTRFTTLGAGLFEFFKATGKEMRVFDGIGVGFFVAAAFDGFLLAFALEAFRGHKTLDAGSFGGGFAVFGDGSADDVFADIVFLVQVEEFADVVGTFGAQSAGAHDVGHAFDFLFALFDNDEMDNRVFVGNDAATNGFAATFTVTTAEASEAWVAFLEQKAHTVVGHNALHHGEALGIMATRDFEDVAIKFVAEVATVNFHGNALFVDSAELGFIVNFDGFLATRHWVGNVELQTNSE